MGTHATQEYYHLSVTEVLRMLNTNEEGLAAEEAARRLATYGPNTITVSGEKKSVHSLWHYANPLLVLQAASSLLLYALDEPIPATALLVLAVLQASLHIARESHQGRPVKALRRLIPQHAAVVRSGDKRTIPASQLTIGDIVYLEAGDVVPADVRIIEEEHLQVLSTDLTGQVGSRRAYTQALTSTTPLADRHNMALCGSTITAGHALGAVVATGKRTVLSHLIHAGVQRPVKPVLQSDMQRISRRLTQAVALLGVVLLPAAALLGLEAQAVLLFAAVLVAAAVPFGLPAAVSLLLAQAAGTLRRSQVQVRKLATIERLSAVTVVLADATNLLTTGRNAARQLHIGSQAYTVGQQIHTAADQPLNSADKQAVTLLCTAAALTLPPRPHATTPPETTSNYEKAIVALASKAGITMQHLGKLYREIHAFPFDARRGRASSIRYFGDKKQQKPHVFVTGTPTAVLESCSKIWEDGRLRRITPEDIQRLKKAYSRAQHDGQQCVAVAYRALPGNTKAGRMNSATAERNLVWLGNIQLATPLHKYVENAVSSLQRARIKLSLITSGPAVTAQALATQAGIAPSQKKVQAFSGSDVARLSNSHLLHVLHAGNAVFYDLSANDKQRLAHLAQQGGNVVVLTGSAPSDIPALHEANISAAPSRAAYVTQKFADLTVIDNNLTSLAHALLSSRATFQKLRLATLATLTSTAAKLSIVVISLVAATLAQIPLALSVTHILAISLLVELLPLAALGSDPAEDSPDQAHPRKRKGKLLSRESALDIAWCGVLIGGLAYINYLLFFSHFDVPAGHVPAGSLLHAKATTLTLATIILCLLIATIQRRFTTGLFSSKQLRNGRFWLACALTIAATYAIIYLPVLADTFATAPLRASDWLYAIGAAIIFALIRELQLHSKKYSRKAVLELHREHRLRVKNNA